MGRGVRQGRTKQNRRNLNASVPVHDYPVLDTFRKDSTDVAHMNITFHTTSAAH